MSDGTLLSELGQLKASDVFAIGAALVLLPGDIYHSTAIARAKSIGNYQKLSQREEESINGLIGVSSFCVGVMGFFGGLIAFTITHPEAGKDILPLMGYMIGGFLGGVWATYNGIHASAGLVRDIEYLANKELRDFYPPNWFKKRPQDNRHKEGKICGRGGPALIIR